MQSAEQVFYEEQFHELVTHILLQLMEAYGTQGFVTDVIEQHNLSLIIYSCGPTPMLKALEINIAIRRRYIYHLSNEWAVELVLVLLVFVI